MKTTRMPLHYCLNVICGKEMDCASGAFGDDTPSKGDVSMCLYCGHMMMFGRKLKLRNLTDAELVEVMNDERVKRMQRMRVTIPELRTRAH